MKEQNNGVLGKQLSQCCQPNGLSGSLNCYRNPLEILMLGCGFGVGGGFAFGVVLSSAFPFRFVFRFCVWFRLGVWSLSGLVLASLLVFCFVCPSLLFLFVLLWLLVFVLVLA